MSDLTTSRTDVTRDLIGRYLKSWNEPDSDRRRELTCDLWTPDGRYADPDSDATGPEAIATVIAGVRDTLGDLAFTLGEVIGAHHDLVLFTWQLRPSPDGAAVAAGYDLARLNDDGRLAAVYGFFVPAA